LNFSYRKQFDHAANTCLGGSIIKPERPSVVSTMVLGAAATSTEANVGLVVSCEVGVMDVWKYILLCLLYILGKTAPN